MFIHFVSIRVCLPVMSLVVGIAYNAHHLFGVVVTFLRGLLIWLVGWSEEPCLLSRIVPHTTVKCNNGISLNPTSAESFCRIRFD